MPPVPQKEPMTDQSKYITEVQFSELMTFTGFLIEVWVKGHLQKQKKKK